MNELNDINLNKILATLLEEIREQAATHASIVSMVDSLSNDVSRILKVIYGLNGEQSLMIRLALIEKSLDEIIAHYPLRPCTFLVEHIDEHKENKSSNKKNWITIIGITLSFAVGVTGIILSLL